MRKSPFDADQNPRLRFEPACQFALTVLSDPEPGESPKFRQALCVIDRTLFSVAVVILTRWTVRQSREAAREAVQHWHRKMLGGGYRQYLQRGAGRPFQPYALRTLRNICVDLARQGRRSRRIDDTFEVVDPRRDPAGAAEHREVLAIVREEFDRLSPTAREALTLTEWDGFIAAEVAEKLHTTPGAIHLRTHRGRQELRDRLLDRGLWPLDRNGR